MSNIFIEANMKQYEFISKNEADTKQLAKKLAAKLKPKVLLF